MIFTYISQLGVTASLGDGLEKITNWRLECFGDFLKYLERGCISTLLNITHISPTNADFITHIFLSESKFLPALLDSLA